MIRHVSRDNLLRDAYSAHRAGRRREAESLYRQLLDVAPDDVDGCNLLGILYIESNRHADAVNVIRRAVRVNTSDWQAQYNLGIALTNSGDAESAERHFSELVRLRPDNPDAHTALGNVRRKLGDLANAERSYRDALKISPPHTAARKGLANALNDIGVRSINAGQSEAALEMFRQATQVDAQHAEAQNNLGIVLEQLGNTDEAVAAFIAAIDARPDLADAHVQLASLRDHASTDAEINAMQALFRESESRDKALLAFGLGKVFQKRASPKDEFEWLARAHDLQSQMEPFDIDKTGRRFDAIKTEFCGQTDATDRGRGLIFVVGMPRSGTSLTEQILASHPMVFGAGETGVVPGAHRERQNNHDCESLAHLGETRLRALGGGAPCVVDTTPSNFLHVGLIAELFPESRVIHCSRGALDMCLSIYQHHLSDAHSYAHRFENLAAYYRLYVDLMEHWRSVYPEMIFDLQYERLVDDLETTVRTLTAFCGLDFDTACLEFHRTRRAVRTPSASRVRRPIYTTSVDRWRRYAKQLEPLIRLLDE